jgi:farnesol dehydrogenase
LGNRKHSITALVRSPRPGQFDNKIKTVHGGVENLSAWKDALRGHDVVLHMAALVKMWVRDSAQFERVNVSGVENLIRASSDAAVGKFVYTSSFIALGPSNGKPVTEADRRRTNHYHNDYERTKFLGDQVARKYLSDGYPLYILYPGVIYGPGNMTDGNIVAKNLIPFLNGRMPFGLTLQDWSYAFVQDVVNGVVKVVEEDPPSRRYILGGENHSGRSFYQTLEAVTGKRPPVFNLPMPLAYLAGLGEYALALTFSRPPSLLTHQVVNIYRHAWAYDSSLAIRELNYRIKPLQEGLAEMVQWLRSAGYVK